MLARPRSLPQSGGIEVPPQRVQRQRAKGWRMPPNTVYVGRPTQWGNPFVVGEYVPPNTFWKHGNYFLVEDAAMAVDLFRHWLNKSAPEGCTTWNPGTLIINQRMPELRGKSLACWCQLNQPCHADVLLELACDAMG